MILEVTMILKNNNDEEVPSPGAIETCNVIACRKTANHPHRSIVSMTDGSEYVLQHDIEWVIQQIT